MHAKWITWDMIPIWSKQQKALSFLVPVVVPTDSNDPHPGGKSKHGVEAKEEFPTFCFSFQWGSQLDEWCWGLKVQSFPPYPPKQAPAHACFYITSHQEQGESVRVLPEGCVSVCWTGSLGSGVGMAGPEIADCPLLSVLPLKQGRFSFLKSQSFYTVERCISERQRKRNSRKQQAGADISWQNFQCGRGGDPVWEFLISRCCSSKCATRQRRSFFYVVVQQSVKKLIHLILNCFVSIVWNRFV